MAMINNIELDLWNLDEEMEDNTDPYEIDDSVLTVGPYGSLDGDFTNGIIDW